MKHHAGGPVTRKAVAWCGPFALATVAGVDYDRAYATLLRRINKQRRYKKTHLQGVSNWYMSACSTTLKCRFTWERTKHHPTLHKLRDELRPNRVYIVNVTEHYIVVDTRDWTTIDNQHMHWTPLSASAHKRCKVRWIAEVNNHKINLPTT